MVFNSASFVVFLLITLSAYWALPWHSVRRALLLVASLVFYAWWDVRFLGLIAYVTLVAYAAALGISKYPQYGKKIITLTLVLQLGQLAVFKYTNFLLGAFGDLAHLAGWGIKPPEFSIILPVGVSFYTFHGISYVVDVYRGKIKEPMSLPVVALYIVFFPQLVAGPIVRSDVFIPQAEKKATIDTRDAITGVKLIVIGLICKCVFADRLAPLVDEIYESPEKFDNLTLASAALGFYSQIYFDFVGYSTMAIGISRLFGFKFPRNFDFPYRAASVTDFWRRWHISLSTWLRDYLYIPLGGNRHGKRAQHRNLFLTMLLGGLWHGASYNFVLWGALHGGALIVHKMFAERFPVSALTGAARHARFAAAWLLTQVFVLVAWVPFRATTLKDTGTVLSALTFLRPDEGLKSAALPLSILFLPIICEHLLVQNPKLPAPAWPRRPILILALLGFCLALALPLIELEGANFIYFQF
jgi:alginate O-acetyltransferase complex protein AlgI